MARNWWNNRVSIRVEHTILRNVRVHRFLRSRRSQFSLSLSYFPSPPLGIELHHLLSRVHPRIPWHLPWQYHSGKTKDGYRVSTRTSFHPSIPPRSSPLSIYREDEEEEEGRGWHRIVRRDYILEQVFFLRYFLRDYFLERNKKCRWKKLKLLPPARVHAL